MFKWKPETTSEQVAAIEAGLATLPGAISAIRDYRFGRDIGENDGNLDFAVTADFDSREDYLVYRDDPTHRALLAETIAPFIGERVAVQFEW